MQELDGIPVTAMTEAHLHKNQLLFLTWLVTVCIHLCKLLFDGPSTQPLDLASQAIQSQPPP